MLSEVHSPVDLLARLPKNSARRRHGGQGCAPASARMYIRAMLASNRNEPNIGVVSMPSGIFPEMKFDQQGAAGFGVWPSGSHTALALLGVTPCTHRRMG